MVTNTTTHIRSVVDEDGAVILDVELNSIVRLNSTGGFIWEGMQAGKSARQIALELAIVTKTEIETVELDIREFIGSLKATRINRNLVGQSNDY
jgi:hypothetical protein